MLPPPAPPAAVSPHSGFQRSSKSSQLLRQPCLGRRQDLIELRCDVERPNRIGRTPLQFAEASSAAVRALVTSELERIDRVRADELAEAGDESPVPEDSELHTV